jgi:hypothetical protein
MRQPFNNLISTLSRLARDLQKIAHGIQQIDVHQLRFACPALIPGSNEGYEWY